MSQEIDWSKRWSEIDAHHVKQLRTLANKGGADGEFFAALLSAYEGCRDNGLLGQRDDNGEVVHTARQARKAACFAREDAAATLIVQRSILRRLSTLQRLAWASIAVLVFIAYRIS